MDNMFGSLSNTSDTPPTTSTPAVTTTTEDVLAPLSPIQGSTSPLAKGGFTAGSDVSSQTGTTLKPGEYRHPPWSSNMPSNMPCNMPSYMSSCMSSNPSGATPVIGIGGSAQFGKHGGAPTDGPSVKKTRTEKDIDDWEVLTKESLDKNDDSADNNLTSTLGKTPLLPTCNTGYGFGGRPATDHQGSCLQPPVYNSLFGCSKPKVETGKTGLFGASQNPNVIPYPDIFEISRQVNLLMNERQEVRSQIARLQASARLSDETRCSFNMFRGAITHRLLPYHTDINWLKDTIIDAASKKALHDLNVELGTIQIDITAMIDEYTDKIRDAKPLVDDLFAKVGTLEQQLQAKTTSHDTKEATNKSEEKAKLDVVQKRLCETEEEIDILHNDMADLTDLVRGVRDKLEGEKWDLFERLERCFRHCGHNEARCGLKSMK